MTAETIKALADKLEGTFWFRKSLHSGTFHLEAKDWVSSGKAACGRPLKNCALELKSPMPDAQLCINCLHTLR